MFTNGPGFAYDVFNVTEVHWRNLSRVDTTSFKYRQLAAVNRPGSETHGGEDVMIYGIGKPLHIQKKGRKKKDCLILIALLQ